LPLLEKKPRVRQGRGKLVPKFSKKKGGKVPRYNPPLCRKRVLNSKGKTKEWTDMPSHESRKLKWGKKVVERLRKGRPKTGKKGEKNDEGGSALQRGGGRRGTEATTFHVKGKRPANLREGGKRGSA